MGLKHRYICMFDENTEQKYGLAVLLLQKIKKRYNIRLNIELYFYRRE